MAKIAPCLWFNGNALAAAEFYAATFPDSRVDKINLSPVDYPAGRAGDVLTVEFSVLGQNFVGLNGGATHSFNEAVSFQLYTDDQAETDRYWEAIISTGGQAGWCSWCKDKFGLSWQIVPRRLLALLTGPDTQAAQLAMAAMMRMQKIDIAAVEHAAAGAAEQAQ
jgi:2-polyprenyl-6-hydroxyphenyl methylase/3-demethylubiquinone-9 3-methyltransferase